MTDTRSLFRDEVERLLPPVDATANWSDVARRARRPRRQSWLKVLVAGAALASATTVGVVALLARPSGADTRPPATDMFSVFQQPPSDDDAARADLALAARVAHPEWDLGQLRVLVSGLGRSNPRVVAFPANDGRNLCYILIGERGTDPTPRARAGYCFSPSRPYASPDAAGEHFSVLALYELTNWEPSVHVFGVAFDDVVNVRVQVSGQWRSLPLIRNGLYLDLPGVERGDVGIFEAVLQDGSVQRHDLQTGRRIS